MNKPRPVTPALLVLLLFQAVQGQSLVAAKSLVEDTAAHSLDKIPFKIAKDSTETARRQAFLLSAYLPNYAIPQLEVSTLSQVDRIIYFGVGIDRSGKLYPAPASDLKKLRTWKERYDLEIYLGVVDHGGLKASQDRGFDLIIRNQKARKNFLDSSLQLLSGDLFSGIDIDWEWPSAGWESQAFAGLLSELADSAADLGAGLSVAMSKWQSIPAETAAKLSQINLMLYDNDDRHSTYEDMVRDLHSFVDNNKLDPSMVSSGLPYYGRGLPQKGKAWSSAISYRSILSRYLIEETTDEVGGYYFNSLATLQDKTRYALDSGFGGVVIWHLGMDFGGNSSLTAGIRRVVTHSLARSDSTLLSEDPLSMALREAGRRYQHGSKWELGEAREKENPGSLPSGMEPFNPWKQGRPSQTPTPPDGHKVLVPGRQVLPLSRKKVVEEDPAQTQPEEFT